MRFDFTKQDYEYISDQCMLNDEMKKIFEMKIKRESITKIAFELNMSERNVNRKIKELKRKIKKVL